MAIKRMGKKIEQSEKKSRAKFQRPDKLEPFIDDANRIRANIVLLNAPETFESNKKIYRTEDGESWLSDDGYFQTLKKTLEDCLAGLPNDFCDYIKEKGTRKALHYQNREDYPGILYRLTLQEYGEFHQLREDLRAYADYFTNWRKHGVITGGTAGTYGADGTPVNLPIPQSIYQMEGTKEGTVTTIVPINLSAALHGVIGERVRSCEICQNIFWASRKDKETCSQPCANNLRVRLSRHLSDKEKADRKAQRDANRERNKKLKQSRVNKNGTV
jgi:hypothetical protein